MPSAYRVCIQQFNNVGRRCSPPMSKPAARMTALQRTNRARQHRASRTKGYRPRRQSDPCAPGGQVRRGQPSPYFFTLARTARSSNLSASPPADTSRLRIRCVENALNGFIEHGIELGVRLLSRQPFNQRPGKAGDHAMIFAQTIVCFFP